MSEGKCSEINGAVSELGGQWVGLNMCASANKLCVA